MKFKLIKKSHIVGNKIIKPLKISPKAEPTEFCEKWLQEIGGSSNASSYWVSKEHSQKTWGYYNFLTNKFIKNNKYNIEPSHGVCFRPVVKYSAIKDDCIKKQINDDGILEVQYGEYPQKLATNWEELAELTQNRSFYGKTENGKLIITEKLYHGLVAGNYFGRTNLQAGTEFEYKGKKYLFFFKHGQKQARDYLWFEVLPIEWLVDESKDIAITKKLLIASTKAVDPKENRIYTNGFFQHDITPSPIDFCNKVNDVKVYKKSKYKIR